MSFEDRATWKPGDVKLTHPPDDLTAAGEPTSWTAVLLTEGTMTDDFRTIDPGALDWRELPLTLMGMVETSAGGHEGAQIAGRIETISRVGDELLAEGVFDGGEYGQEIARLVREGTLRGISVDLAIREFELRTEDGERAEEDDMFADDPLVFAVLDGSIMGATVCPFPAFAGATINLLEDKETAQAQVGGRIELAVSAVAAGAAPALPPADWFEDPELAEPTPLTVTDEGRVFGHAAAFGVCHISDPHGAGHCVLAPRNHSGYAYFHTGSLRVQGGTVSVGQITLGTGHAGPRANRAQAAAHYDNTGACAADVRVGEDRHGIWVAGALRPDFPEHRIRELTAASLSGDWRAMNGQLELVALLAVNVPGFPIPRPEARVTVAAGTEQVVALTAAGLVCDCDEPEIGEAAAARRRHALAARAHGGMAGLAELARRG